MTRLKTITFFILLAMLLACEKGITDEPEETDGKEIVDDNGGKGDNGDDENELPGGEDDGDQEDDEGQEDDGGNGGGTNDDPVIEDGNDTGQSPGIQRGDTITVNDFLTKDWSGGVFVKGYIAGSCYQNIKNADLEPPFEKCSALLLSDEKDEKDIDKMMSVELKSGSAIRETLDLTKHPELYGKRLLVFGYRTKYLGILGMKDVGKSFWLLE